MQMAEGACTAETSVRLQERLRASADPSFGTPHRFRRPTPRTQRPEPAARSTPDTRRVLSCAADDRAATKPNLPLKQSDRPQRHQQIGSTSDAAARLPARRSLNVVCAFFFASFLGFSEPLISPPHGAARAHQRGPAASRRSVASYGRRTSDSGETAAMSRSGSRSRNDGRSPVCAEQSRSRVARR
jgi:hypothetical protein